MAFLEIGWHFPIVFSVIHKQKRIVIKYDLLLLFFRDIHKKIIMAEHSLLLQDCVGEIAASLAESSISPPLV